MKKLLTTICCLISAHTLPAQTHSAAGIDGNIVEVASRTALRVIADADFNLVKLPQRALPFPVIADMTHSTSKNAYAEITFEAKSSGEYILGIDATGSVTILLNNKKICASNGTGKPFPREAAYDCYEFGATCAVSLHGGRNTLTIKGPGSKVSLGIITGESAPSPYVSYSRARINENGRWLTEPEAAMEYRLQPKPGAAFTKHPYTEWHYANGATMIGMLAMSDATGEEVYAGFVDRFCRQTIATMPLFASQYYGQNSLRTQNYRYFRMTMLDDSGAPALPFAELCARGLLPGARGMLDTIAVYVMTGQPRLPDGTFCRPEPRWTVWADDLFMSAPFLMRYARITGDHALYDEAARQVILFDRHLYVASTGLFMHGWNDTEKCHVGAFWGRANGWIAWAVTEVLEGLPADHKDRGAVLEIYRRQMAGAVKYQSPGGLWHQVLNDSTSYTETSASAAFVLALARGVRNGWIGPSYAACAASGWKAIARRVDQNGVTTGICQSMPIGYTMEHYLNRPTSANDPRGMGAVLTAAVEVDRMLHSRAVQKQR